MKITFLISVSLLTSLSCFGQTSLTQQETKDSLINELAIIAVEDQKYRNQLDSVRVKHGGDSNEMMALIRKMKETDSLNLVKVTVIIDRYGWLGSNAIGTQGNTTLFMVIQHSKLKSQIKYLPLMRDAVKNGNAKASDLALMEDRVAIYQGKKQIYGSQVSWNMKTNEFYIIPLDDPDNVDKRRAEMGMGSLADYVKDCCNLVWNVEQYKKDLSSIEADFFKRIK